jgi:hypothetical protein
MDGRSVRVTVRGSIGSALIDRRGRTVSTDRCRVHQSFGVLHRRQVGVLHPQRCHTPRRLRLTHRHRGALNTVECMIDCTALGPVNRGAITIAAVGHGFRRVSEDAGTVASDTISVASCASTTALRGCLADASTLSRRVLCRDASRSLCSRFLCVFGS